MYHSTLGASAVCVLYEWGCGLHSIYVIMLHFCTHMHKKKSFSF